MGMHVDHGSLLIFSFNGLTPKVVREFVCQLLGNLTPTARLTQAQLRAPAAGREETPARAAGFGRSVIKLKGGLTALSYLLSR
jgi:hypothetical protein